MRSTQASLEVSIRRQGLWAHTSRMQAPAFYFFSATRIKGPIESFLGAAFWKQPGNRITNYGFISGVEMESLVSAAVTVVSPTNWFCTWPWLWSWQLRSFLFAETCSVGSWWLHELPHILSIKSSTFYGSLEQRGLINRYSDGILLAWSEKITDLKSNIINQKDIAMQMGVSVNASSNTSEKNVYTKHGFQKLAGLHVMFHEIRLVWRTIRAPFKTNAEFKKCFVIMMPMSQ